MKKSVFVLGFITFFLISMGLLFKIMHWPMAGIMLVCGVAAFGFGLLPVLSWQLYRKYGSA